MTYERNELANNIKKLRDFMRGLDKGSDMYFLAERTLELYQIVLSKYKGR